MKEFTERVNVKNKEFFNEYLYERNICYMRRDIYDLILRGDENDYFDLTKFNENRVNDIEITNKMIKTIIQELYRYGWNCKLCYGDTGLYIYSDTVPIGCGDEL
jgi:hypothetical protein